MTGVQTGRYAYAAAQHSNPVQRQSSRTGQAEQAAEQKQGEPVSKMTYGEMTEYITGRAQEVLQKLQNGKTEVKRQLGGAEFTDEQWDKLMARVDAAIKAMQEEQEKRHQKSSAVSKKQDGEENDTVQEKIGTVFAEETTETTSKMPEKKVLYVTCITPEGVSCKKAEQSINDPPLWEIKFKSPEEYKRVMDFMKQFEQDDNLLFAPRQDFWEKLLSGEIDGNHFHDFYEDVKNGGIPLTDPGAGAAGPTKEQLSYLKYVLEPMEISFSLTAGEDAREQLFANTPESVREAWDAAAEKTGIAGFLCDADGKMQYTSQLLLERIVGEHQDYSTLLGDSVLSACEFAQRAIDNLRQELARTSDGSADARRSHEQELQFYQEFLHNLS